MDGKGGGVFFVEMETILMTVAADREEMTALSL